LERHHAASPARQQEESIVSYAVIARYCCSSAEAEQIRERLLQMREDTLKEPANITYVVHEEIDDEVDGQVAFLLYEQYTDRDGFEAHTKTQHFVEHVGGFIRPRLLDRTVHFAEVL
jgi:quinol monooxygenase YgiN